MAPRKKTGNVIHVDFGGILQPATDEDFLPAVSVALPVADGDPVEVTFPKMAKLVASRNLVYVSATNVYQSFIVAMTEGSEADRVALKAWLDGPAQSFSADSLTIVATRLFFDRSLLTEGSAPN